MGFLFSSERFLASLDETGLSRVRLNLAAGVYNERKAKIAREWVRQNEGQDFVDEAETPLDPPEI